MMSRGCDFGWQLSTKKQLLTNGQHTNASIPNLQDIVTVSHDGAWHEDIEIELRGKDGVSFNGTITILWLQ